MKKGLSVKDDDYLKYTTFITDEELMTMTDISTRKTGIKDVVIWVGHNPHTNDKRIKVSKQLKARSKDDCFTITIPEFKVLGNPNKELITDDVMKDIRTFVELNMQLIFDYSDEKMTTDEFFDKIVGI
jgi:hypothetical protein